jgi:tRNA A-37 threonylcarbamoyl transferase component Bud32
MAMRCRYSIDDAPLVKALGLDVPSRVAAWSRGEVVSASSFVTVYRFRAPEAGGALFFLKVYRYRRIKRIVTSLWRRSHALVEDAALRHLRDVGLPAVEPVVAGSHRRGLVLESAYVLTRGVEGAVGLDAFLEGFFAGPRTPTWAVRRRRLLDDLADLVRRMHEAHFFHYDLKFRNILVRESEAGDLTWFLIDFPKGRLISPRRTRAQRAARIWDLACLDKHAPRWFSRADRLRFFHRYREADRLSATDRDLVRRVGVLRCLMNAKSARKSGQRERQDVG